MWRWRLFVIKFTYLKVLEYLVKCITHKKRQICVCHLREHKGEEDTKGILNLLQPCCLFLPLDPITITILTKTIIFCNNFVWSSLWTQEKKSIKSDFHRNSSVRYIIHLLLYSVSFVLTFNCLCQSSILCHYPPFGRYLQLHCTMQL